MDYRCKLETYSFPAMPNIQWDGPCKLWVALWDATDNATFITEVAPHLLTVGYSVSDEHSGAQIHEQEIM